MVSDRMPASSRKQDELEFETVDEREFEENVTVGQISNHNLDVCLDSIHHDTDERELRSRERLFQWREMWSKT
jgi:hypothetical protein